MVDEQGAAGLDLAHELTKRIYQGRLVAVDIQVVGIGAGHDGHVGVQRQEAAVVLVGFYHDGRIGRGRQQQVAAQVHSNATQKGPDVEAGVVQQVGHHAAGGGFAVRASHGNGVVPVGEHAQHLAALANVVVLLSQPGPFPTIGGDGGREHHQRLRAVRSDFGRNILHRIGVVNGNAFDGQRLGERSFSLR